jgi:hypothetical protein
MLPIIERKHDEKIDREGEEDTKRERKGNEGERENLIKMVCVAEFSKKGKRVSSQI